MRKFIIIFILTLINLFGYAQTYTLSGSIKDQSGEPIPFTTIRIENTSKGTSANIEGIYQLKLSAGDNTLLFKAIGFEEEKIKLNLTSNQTLDVRLKPEIYELASVTVTSNGKVEDLAYPIIRKAIAQRKNNLNETESYRAKVYIKGAQKLIEAPKKILGRDVQKLLELDENRQGILYLSESESIFNFRKPNDIYEEMISSKIAGSNNGFSFNKASDLLINFYENILLEGRMSNRGFISPIADNAMLYYRYKLKGEHVEHGHTIHKIEVTPRRTNDPSFRGTIYITEDNWRIYSTNLYLTNEAGINLLDTLTINQQFNEINDQYFQSSINLNFTGKILGFKFTGYYLGMFTDYEIDPVFPKNYFKSEILKISESVNKKDSSYWNSNRPIPLTLEETNNYIKKDSIAQRKESEFYLDSLEKANNSFKLTKILLTTYTKTDRFNKKYITFDPILRSVYFNTVEGLTLKYGFNYRKELENRKQFNLRPELRYGFANKKLNGALTANYYYDPIKRANIGGSVGYGVYDLNNLGSMNALGNTINTLIYERNYPKFYDKSFVNINTSKEIANGLSARIDVDYSRNKNLTNNILFSFIDHKGIDFTSNNPLTPLAEEPLFPTYNSFNTTITLDYSIGRKYITRPDGKFYTENKYPKITAVYKKGINGILGSDVNYDFVQLELLQNKISFGMWGYSTALIGAGVFLNNKNLFYPEFKHFSGNISTVFPPNIRKFQYLDFYDFSTRDKYFEFHYEHNFAGLITNKIPLLNKLKLKEFVGVGYLSSPQKQGYKEFYFGIERLIFRISYGFSYDGTKKITQGIRLSYGF